MASMPIYGKMPQNLFLWKQRTDFHELWYVAQGTQAHYILFTLSPWDDHDLFHSKVKFATGAFIQEKATLMEFLQLVAWKLVDIINLMSK